MSIAMDTNMKMVRTHRPYPYIARYRDPARHDEMTSRDAELSNATIGHVFDILDDVTRQAKAFLRVRTSLP